MCPIWTDLDQPRLLHPRSGTTRWPRPTRSPAGTRASGPGLGSSSSSLSSVETAAVRRDADRGRWVGPDARDASYSGVTRGQMDRIDTIPHVDGIIMAGPRVQKSLDPELSTPRIAS